MAAGLKIRASSATSQWCALLALGLGASLAASAAYADPPSAEAAISNADGRIEMAARQSGGAGDAGDQSYALARARLQSARDALKAGREDRAEMLAKEASLLADLTVEKAKLAALQTSHDLVASAANPSPTQ
jgi:hypothetical protein